tara:strand:+ start:5070 stop:5342 length:273 start_codon:yes stop_codon:yes gene_type:complete
MKKSELKNIILKELKDLKKRGLMKEDLIGGGCGKLTPCTTQAECTEGFTCTCQGAPFDCDVSCCTEGTDKSTWSAGVMFARIQPDNQIRR